MRGIAAAAGVGCRRPRASCKINPGTYTYTQFVSVDSTVAVCVCVPSALHAGTCKQHIHGTTRSLLLTLLLALLLGTIGPAATQE
jgi:hypothetical protein